jgi:prepilin-type N-terminal cleavage/methylation domain-containing protein
MFGKIFTKIGSICGEKMKTKQGFTLIELLVAIFIFSLITIAIVSVFVSTVTAYGKAKAIKTVKENAQFAMNSVAKDIRMGKIESYYKVGAGSPVPQDGTLKSYLVISRNRGGKVCYHLDTDNNFLGIQEGIGDDNACSDNSDSYKKLIDLSQSGMEFASSAGFYSCPSTFGTPSVCPAGGTTSANRRGWVEMNFNINMKSGREMEADQINIQMIVSSRDYGWEEI